MTDVATDTVHPSPAVPPELTRAALSGRRRFLENLTRVFMVGMALLAAIPLGLVVYHVVRGGIGAISWDFLTSERLSTSRREVGGIGPAVIGTLVVTGVAAAIAIPVGVLGAIYLNEYGKRRAVARAIRTMADVMTGVPSIVIGIFIYVIMVVPLGQRSTLAGSFALACLMLPVVIRSSEEMLALVPNELREASLALGTRTWRMILTVVLPAATPGITSGALLAIARAAGETAPIVLVVGGATRVSLDLFDESNALSALIFRNANQSFETYLQRGWGAALTLMALVLVLTLIARLIASRYAIKER